jgi:hypothetical protein
MARTHAPEVASAKNGLGMCRVGVIGIVNCEDGLRIDASHGYYTKWPGGGGEGGGAASNAVQQGRYTRSIIKILRCASPTASGAEGWGLIGAAHTAVYILRGRTGWPGPRQCAAPQTTARWARGQQAHIVPRERMERKLGFASQFKHLYQVNGMHIRVRWQPYRGICNEDIAVVAVGPCRGTCMYRGSVCSNQSRHRAPSVYQIPYFSKNK